MLHAGYGQCFDVREVLFERRTEHQHLVIFDSASFGRVMALDGVVQTTERDEFIYHEMLAHVPLFAHPAPKAVLIIGGGDGGLLREVLKHDAVERIVLVEIDSAVIDLCKRYFPQHSQGAFDDTRLEIVIGDGIDYVCSTEHRFDVVLSDCTDPIGPGEVLFSSRFYEGVKHALNSGGIFAAQNGSAFLQPEEITTTWQRLSPYFSDRWFFTAAVPTYVGGLMTLAWASDDAQLRALSLATLQTRFAHSNMATRCYNPEIHAASFALPQYVRELCTS
ncbi:MAG: polyamine aminopropyltransferase [Spongiibacteraceae bacterium]